MHFSFQYLFFDYKTKSRGKTVSFFFIYDLVLGVHSLTTYKIEHNNLNVEHNTKIWFNKKSGENEEFFLKQIHTITFVLLFTLLSILDLLFGHGPILMQMILQHSKAQTYDVDTRIISLTQTQTICEESHKAAFSTIDAAQHGTGRIHLVYFLRI